jgi:hypothetical protein
MMVRAQEKPLLEEDFDYLKMFKHVAVSDEELASRLPKREFELTVMHQHVHGLFDMRWWYFWNVWLDK